MKKKAKKLKPGSDGRKAKKKVTISHRNRTTVENDKFSIDEEKGEFMLDSDCLDFECLSMNDLRAMKEVIDLSIKVYERKGNNDGK